MVGWHGIGRVGKAMRAASCHAFSPLPAMPKTDSSENLIKKVGWGQAGGGTGRQGKRWGGVAGQAVGWGNAVPQVHSLQKQEIQSLPAQEG